MIRVPPERFEELVLEAVESLPEEFLSRLDNVDVVVQDAPTRAQLAEHNLGPGQTLFGLYHGVPMTRRDSFGPVLPDKITIFQRPLENHCNTEEELIEQVQMTVMHEIAHFFGIDDDRLDELGL